MHYLDSLVADTTVCTCCIILLVTTVCLNRRHLFYVNLPSNSGTGYFMLWIVFTIYSSLYCPPLGDNWRSGVDFYYPYLQGVSEDNLHFEHIYFRIMDLVPYGYVFWRIAVWGVLGATSYIILCKLLKFDKHIATIMCLTFALPNLFYYQRAVIGYCLLYIGVALWLKEYGFFRTKINNILLSIVLLLVSLAFHNAMPFYLTILVLSFYIPINKKTLFLILITGVVCSLSIINYATLFLENTSKETYDVGMNYLMQEHENSRNIFGKMFFNLEKLPAYVIILFSLYLKLEDKYKFERFEEICLTNSFMLVFISLLFSSTSIVIQGKFYVASMLPLTLFLTYFFQKNRGSKICRFFIYLTLLCLVLTNGYRILTGQLYNTI